MVVGAGIAGLGAALELQQHVGEVVLIDAGDRPGGVMRTDHASGFVIERGPNTIQVKAPLRELVESLGMAGALQRAQPASKRRYVLRGDHLEPVPMSPISLASTPLLSLRGKLRLLVEPLMRRGDPSGESVAEFASRRLGREAVENLIGPFLTGVYAGDEGALGVEAVFPGLVEHERRFGSLALGALASALSRGKPRGWPGSWGAEEGFGPFARHLAERLSEPPALNSQVVSASPDAGLWRVAVRSPSGESELATRRLVVAAPAREAGLLLRTADAALASALLEIDYAPVASIALGVDSAQLRNPVDGFGFLVPRSAGGSLLGCLYMSQLFPSRAPAGHELLQCLCGGSRWPEALEEGDESLLARVCEDLEPVLGLREAPQLLAVTRWPRAIAQPDRRHALRADGMRRRLEECPGLALAGGYLEGVSVPDALASGIRAARSLTG